MELRALLEQLEAAPGEPRAAVAWLAAQALAIPADELAGVRRRALLLLASGGDPHRDLDPDDRAVRAVAEELDSPERRARLADSLTRLRSEADGLGRLAGALDALLADGELAWRWAACALLAEELGG